MSQQQQIEDISAPWEMPLHEYGWNLGVSKLSNGVDCQLFYQVEEMSKSGKAVLVGLYVVELGVMRTPKDEFGIPQDEVMRNHVTHGFTYIPTSILKNTKTRLNWIIRNKIEIYGNGLDIDSSYVRSGLRRVWSFNHDTDKSMAQRHEEYLKTINEAFASVKPDQATFDPKRMSSFKSRVVYQ